MYHLRPSLNALNARNHHSLPVIYKSPYSSRSLHALQSCQISYVKPVTSHALFVTAHKIPTLFLRIVRPREQHAFVALGFLIGAYTAGLFQFIVSSSSAIRGLWVGTLTFCVASPVGLSSEARLEGLIEEVDATWLISTLRRAAGGAYTV